MISARWLPGPVLPSPRFGQLVLIATLVAAPAARAQTFVNANSADVTAHVAFSTGASWVDFDGDGDLDLYVVCGFSANNNNVLYRNDGGTLVAVPGVPITTDAAETPCSAWADVDNDGDFDAYVSNLGTGEGHLYLNQGGGVLTVAPGFPAGIRGVGCAFGDYDRDGLVDLVVSCIAGQLGMSTGNRLFHNEGGGVFGEVTTAFSSVLDSHHHPTWTDFDGDGDLDLFFATGTVNALDTDRFYRNRLRETSTPTFEPLTGILPATDLRDSQMIQWIDYDNDGDLDCFAVNYTTVPNQLYRRDGPFTFTKITTGALVTTVQNYHGAAWGDFDNDGDLDVYVSTDLGQPNRYFRNDGGGTFTRITTGAFVTEGLSNYGVSCGDLDRDGDLDLFVPTARSEGPSRLFRNDLAATNGWLVVKLEGVASNRAGIGARIRARAVFGGAPRWQRRDLLSGSYGGHDMLEAHFGLGDAAVVDSLVVDWPSGLTQVLTGVAIRQRLVVTEDVPTPALASLVSSSAEPGRVLLEWRVPNPAPVTVERRVSGGTWQSIETLHPDGLGHVRFRDDGVQPGTRYEYRLALADGGGIAYAGEIALDVPFARLALAAVRRGECVIAAIEIPARGDVALELFDANGRRRMDPVRVTLDAGRHEIPVAAPAGLPAGLYWVRLTHPGGARSARVTWLR